MNTDRFATTADAETSEGAEETPLVTGEAASDQSPSRRAGHPFDPISAVFGLLACFAGAVAATGQVDPIGADDAGTWVAAAGIAVGVVLLPWGARRT